MCCCVFVARYQGLEEPVISIFTLCPEDEWNRFLQNIDTFLPKT
jgi:hypothetical protein